jgi:hypothetical protein
MTEQEFDFSVDLLQCLLWQYDSSPHLRALLESKQAWYDEKQQDFWESWVRDVFDLTTANDFGLAVWARILNVPLYVSPTDDGDKPIWGFAPDDANFTHGNFSGNTGVSTLTTEQRRLVLRLRYFQLVTRGAVPEVNEFLSYLFGPGKCYVVDGLHMNIVMYVFTEPIPSSVEQVLSEFDVLPRPAGVGVGYVVQGEADGWGFGRYHNVFNQDNFKA